MMQPAVYAFTSSTRGAGAATSTGPAANLASSRASGAAVRIAVHSRATDSAAAGTAIPTDVERTSPATAARYENAINNFIAALPYIRRATAAFTTAARITDSWSAASIETALRIRPLTTNEHK
jgi:hypothetical protein